MKIYVFFCLCYIKYLFCTKFRKKNDVYCLLVRCRTFGLCIYPVRQLKYIIY